MSGIFTPINQVKLTNVSVVRLKKGGKRFELACYKNKLLDFRSGATVDIDSILQSPHIFSNVPKGLLAPSSDLSTAFPPAQYPSTQHVIREILTLGQVQMGEKEREHVLQSLQREVATLVAERLVNPTSYLPYPVSIIERAMSEELHYSLRPEKSAKQQALEVCKLLAQKSTLPVIRARLLVSLDVVEGELNNLPVPYDLFKNEKEDGSKRVSFYIEPADFRKLQSFAQEQKLNLIILND